MRMRDELEQKVGLRFSKGLLAATNQEIYQALLELTQEKLAAARPITGERKLYYISAEFLVGKLLSNNLINLGLYDEVKAALAEAGKDLAAVEEVEPEPSLGNGGLGRLAACYLDSAATLGLPGDGVGLLYHFGLFRQVFQEHKQQERPDAWLSPQSWLNPTGVRFTVPFPQGEATAVLYDLYVSGYESGVNKLHLFDLETVDESLVGEGIDFDKTDVLHNLTLFLYPDDSDRAGRLLRVYQQYFMVSAAAQLILKELEDKGHPLEELHKYAVIQINDTHPSMVIPELIRLLTARGLTMDQAVEHGVQNLRLHQPHHLGRGSGEVAPGLPGGGRAPAGAHFAGAGPAGEGAAPRPGRGYPGRRRPGAHGPPGHPLRLLGQRGGQPAHGDSGEVRADGLCPSSTRRSSTTRPTASPSAGGCMHCNPELSRLDHGENRPGLEEGRRRSWKGCWPTKTTQRPWRSCSPSSRRRSGPCARPSSSGRVWRWSDGFHLRHPDQAAARVQAPADERPVHHLRSTWRIKAGHRAHAGPSPCIFGAKAAPGLHHGQGHHPPDPVPAGADCRRPPGVPLAEGGAWWKTTTSAWAEKLIPACDISEQISLACKEASGTGNMKFMLNGAVTLGTLDGANVEIARPGGGGERVHLRPAQREGDGAVRHGLLPPRATITAWTRKSPSWWTLSSAPR